jgi:hypothetical protein
VSFVDVLRGDEAAWQKLRGKKVIVGGTALELGDRFSVPNGVILSGPVLQTLAAESLLQNRALQWTSHIVTLTGLALLALIMLLTWRRLSAGKRVAMLAAMAVGIEAVAHLLQAKFPLILDIAVSHSHLVHRCYRADEIDTIDRPSKRGFSAWHVARRRPDSPDRLPDHGLESRRDGDFRLSAGGDDRPTVPRDRRPRRICRHADFLDQRCGKAHGWNGGRI